MKVYDLDGKQSILSLAGYSVDGSHTRPRSQLHVSARQILKQTYPLYSILEEISVNLKRGSTVFLDFFIPQLKMCVEVNGEQHFKCVTHFHGSLAGFRNQQKNDRLKREWLELNGIKLVEFNYNETEEEWQTKLIKPRTTK